MASRPTTDLTLLPLVLAALLAAGCGAGAQSTARTTTPRPRRVVQMEEMHIGGSGEGVAGLGNSYDANMLFDQATNLLNSRRCDDAVALYERLAREFPESRLLSPSLYNSGLCLEDRSELPRAADKFRALIALPSRDPRDALHAHFMLSNITVRLGLWDEAIALCDAALANTDLDPDDRMALLARKAQAQFGAGRLDLAERDARGALAYYRMQEESQPVQDDFSVGAAGFVVSEALRERAGAIHLPQGTTEVQRVALEERARVMLEAQREYFNTIRLGNAHWAAASGYRIGQMYDSFWTEITNAPVPPRPDLSRELYAVFSDEYHKSLRELVKPLLQHAIRYWEMTLLMVERTGVRSEWTERTRADLARVQGTLVEQVPGAAPPPPVPPPAPAPGAPGAGAATAQSPTSPPPAAEAGANLAAPPAHGP
jgi:tetratricopeptide (TPR) repeat protein